MYGVLYGGPRHGDHVVVDDHPPRVIEVDALPDSEKLELIPEGGEYRGAQLERHAYGLRGIDGVPSRVAIYLHERRVDA